MLPVLIAFAGVLIAAVATGMLAGRRVRGVRVCIAGWTGATLGLMVASAAAGVGLATGFGPVSFRAVEIGGQLFAPLWLAWGLVEFVARSAAVRVGVRLGCGFALTAGAGLILATGRLSAVRFAKTWPSASQHYQRAAQDALTLAQAVAIVAAITAVALALARARREREWAPAVPGIGALGLAVLLTVALRFPLPTSSAYPLLAAIAAGLIWFGVTRGLSTVDDSWRQTGREDRSRRGFRSRRDDRDMPDQQDAPEARDLRSPQPQRDDLRRSGGYGQRRDVRGSAPQGYEPGQYAQNSAGADAYGADSYGQGSHGADSYAADSYQPDEYGQDRFRQDQYGRGSGPHGRGQQAPDPYRQGHNGSGSSASAQPAPDPYGYGQQGRDSYGQEQYAPSPYESSQYGQEQYGQPQYGQAQYALDPYAQSQYAQDQYGQGQHAQDQYGQGQHVQGQHGQGQYGQGQYAADRYVPDPHGQEPYPADQYRQQANGASQYGQSSHLADAYPQPPSAPDPYAQPPYAQPPSAPDPYAQATAVPDPYAQPTYVPDAYLPDPYGQAGYVPDQYSADQPGADRHEADQYGSDRYGSDQGAPGRHASKHNGADPHRPGAGYGGYGRDAGYERDAGYADEYGQNGRYADNGRGERSSQWLTSQSAGQSANQPTDPRATGLAAGAPLAQVPTAHGTAEAELRTEGGPDSRGGAQSRPYGRLQIFTLLDDKAADFDQLAEQTAEEVRIGEPDTLVYVIHLVPNAPMQRIFYEIYRDRAAFESHENKSYTQRFVSERRACVLATNIIELRLKYAKVAPLPVDARQLDAVRTARAQLPPGSGANGSRPDTGPTRYDGTAGRSGGYAARQASANGQWAQGPADPRYGRV